MNRRGGWSSVRHQVQARCSKVKPGFSKTQSFNFDGSGDDETFLRNYVAAMDNAIDWVISACA